MATPRSLNELGYVPAESVQEAVRLMQEKYGSNGYRDSGHRKGSPTWIFEFPDSGAEIGLRMNKNALTLYMRDRTLSGGRLSGILPPEKIAKLYPRDGQPAQSVLNSPFLSPSEMEPVLLLELEAADLEPLFAAFFGRSEKPAAAAAAEAERKAPARTRPIDADEFDLLLERRSEIGAAGELLVVQDELRRLQTCGCPEPERWIRRVALEDVGRGYDIESTWPGEERYIEVKTSTRPSSPLFITQNECRALRELGTKAWLYRVCLDADGGGQVLCRLRDPMRALAPVDFEPVVFRLQARALEQLYDIEEDDATTAAV